VARAMGQQDIEAKVMVWQVTGPLPWETRTRPASHNSIDQKTPSFRNLLTAIGIKLRARMAL
jgi:hypothetical protein